MSRTLMLTLALSAFAPSLAFGETLHRTGSSASRHDLVILADGYRASEREEFDREALAVLQALRAAEPFRSNMGRMNVHTGFRPSARSGPSETNNAYGTHFGNSFFLSFDTRVQANNRLLIMQDAARFGGDADSILVILKSSRRGGTAYGHLCFVTSGAGHRTALHELGHAIGRLGDEYSTGDLGITRQQVARLYPNLTTANTRAQLPWRDLVHASTPVPGNSFTSGVSAFEGGGTFATGVYRPQRSCRMRTDGPGFCAVCQTELARAIRADSTGSGPATTGGTGGSTTTTGGGGGNFNAQVVNVSSRLRVRAQPTTASAVLGHLQPNQLVRVVGNLQGGWYPIDFNGRRGWVSRNFIRGLPQSAGVSAAVAGMAR